MGGLTDQMCHKHLGKRYIGNGDFKSRIVPHQNRMVGPHGSTHQPEQCLTGILALVVGRAVQLNAENQLVVLVIALTVLGGLHILLKRLNPAFGAADLSQKDAGHGVLQSVMLAVVGGLQRAKPCNLNIKVHLFLDHRVPGSQRLYLSVGERSLVQVLTASGGGFRRHDLRNKLLFVFDQLIAVGVKRGLRYVNKNRNLLVHVTLPHHASVALGNIGWPPWAIKVMECTQPRLYVGASAHLLGATHQHANRTAADFAEQLCLLGFRIGIMDELYLLFGNATRHQFVPNIVVHIKAVRAGCAQIAENHLRGALRLCSFPNGKDPLHASIRLAVGVIGQKRIHQPLVQRQLPAIVRDAQHVVLVRGYQAVAHRLGPLTQRRYHLTLQLTGRQLYNRGLAACDFRDRQLQHIGSLNVGALLEHIHKLGQIVELCKPRFRTVAVALGEQFVKTIS